MPRSRAALSTAVALTLIGTGLSALPAGAAAAADPAHPQYLGRTHYTGEFHAHTEVSDGVQLPTDAFEHVAENTDADFFTVSEHDVLYDRRNSDDFTTDWQHSVSDEWRYIHEQSDAFNAAQHDLVTLAAEEITWYDDSGHMNLFNTDWLVTARAQGDSLSFGAATGDLKYDLPTFYARLKQDPDAIAQFNHPDPNGKGAFAGFGHLDRAVDDRVDLIEVRNATQLAEFGNALDAGWHLAPVWNGDEHSANWVTSDEAITGVWATGKSRDAVYQAMRERSMYSTQDVNTVLRFGANEQLMGSILPADTATVSLDIGLTDPDGEQFTSVRVVTNGGETAYQAKDVSGSEVALAPELAAADGDYFYLVATQADDDVIVSAPVWIGEQTRGADYAPTIELPAELPTVAYGDRVELPDVTAIDDSGEQPEISYQVWDDGGEIEVTDGGFTVGSYADQIVVVKATDSAGNVGSEMIRLPVEQDGADPVGVFRPLGSTATVGSEPGSAGISVSTDATVDTVYAQVRNARSDTWRRVEVLESTGDQTYEINTIGLADPDRPYQDRVTGQPLRSHEFELAGLRDGVTYEYRFGVSPDGGWTDVQGSFTAGGKRNRPIYLLGDLAADSREQTDLAEFRAALDRVQQEVPGGDVLVQTGDLVASGVHREYWEDAFAHVYAGLELQVAPVVGDGENDFDRDYNITVPEKNQLFSAMYALPDGGPFGESNYSFDRGDVHVAVLNTVQDLDSQLEWLVDDVHASDAAWYVVVGHQPFFGGQGAEGSGMKDTRTKISELFTRLGVDLYVGGGDNVYRRTEVGDTTYVTLGSAGPRTGEKVDKPWDDVVDNDPTPMGTALLASSKSLSLQTFTAGGRPVDDVELTRPRKQWDVSSAEFVDETLPGIGLISHPGSPPRVTVEAVTSDVTGEVATDRRLATVDLDHRGAEQWVTFDSPLPVAAKDTVTLRFWDSPDRDKQLREPLVLREGLAGAGTAESPYLLDSADDLGKVDLEPAAHYRLAADLDLTDAEDVEQIGVTAAFSGVLDGAGHTVTGLTTTHGGLIKTNAGTVHDLGIVDADIADPEARAGILADTNTGTIERVFTTGLITGASRVGGIAGDNGGVLRDSYSTARVQSFASEAGGAVGVALAGSTTERVYAAGAVGASTKNTGGLAGYGYNGTAIRSSLALMPTITAPEYAHRLLGRELAGQHATLENNWGGENVVAQVQSVDVEPAADNLKGATASAAQTTDPAFYADVLGWDLDGVWTFNTDAGRPLLRSVTETVDPGAEPGVPSLPQDSDGAYQVGSVADLQQLSTFPDQRYRLTADLDLSGVEGINVARSGFSGEFDGAGHRISGLSSSTGGLFPLVTADGHLHDLAVDTAAVETTANNVGILVNTNHGTVERVSTSGVIYGGSTVGGVVGYLYGELRDSYSTADVYATGGRQAGGVAGITGRGSLTEFTYATGHVEVVGNANVGGISGYAYTGTTVRHNVALNSEVVGTSYAHRVVARVLAGETATLVDNAAADSVAADHQSLPEVGPETLNGATLSAAQVADPATYRGMGWDLDAVWSFDSGLGRPVLRSLS